MKAIFNPLEKFTTLLFKINSLIKFIKLRYLDFVPRSDDIFVVTYPRSGTTWLEMILYQLTTDGNMDFTHISERCPWFERSPLVETDLESFPSPRIFKSHLSYRWIPKGPCKYIDVARNGKDVAVSFFHFYTTHLGFKGTFSEFFDLFIRGKLPASGSWFKHVSGWWSHKEDSNVLFLKYEDLTHDLDSCIQKIIALCELEVESERFTDILEKCSFTFMKEHESKFDHLTEFLLENGFKQGSFVRKGQGNKREHTQVIAIRPLS